MSGPSGSISNCGLIGKTASQAEAQLSNRGIGIEWRVMHWGTLTTATAPGSPGAVTGAQANAV
ncbi:MAG: hypothetical protein ACJ752_04365 [Gaiellaceae bacterium]